MKIPVGGTWRHIVRPEYTYNMSLHHAWDVCIIWASCYISYDCTQKLKWQIKKAINISISKVQIFKSERMQLNLHTPGRFHSMPAEWPLS